ncbi:MAG: BrnA antitoxin family protein [Alphaproteobacteria bacterium]
MTDAEVRAAAAKDVDTFIPDKEWWRRARIVVPTPKRLISLRLDADVVAWFRKQGRGYQTRMNAVLRSYVAAQDDDRGGKRATGD